MSKKLSDYLVFCDMDNTLLTAKEGIPACNKTVIELFIKLGGRFSVSSGRPPESVRAALGDISLSLPAITCNGSVLYDMKNNKVLRYATLNREQATAAIDDVMKHFPHMGVEVMVNPGEMYVIRANSFTHAHQVDEKLCSVACPIESVPDGWVKVVFASDPESIRKLNQYTKTQYYGHDNYFLATNSIYLEIMPVGIGKASALKDLCAIEGEAIENTIVIGDYYNDLEIMKEAGYSVAVANAPGEVKTTADETTICSCTEGAVGEFLYKLISQSDEC